MVMVTSERATSRLKVTLMVSPPAGDAFDSLDGCKGLHRVVSGPLFNLAQCRCQLAPLTFLQVG